MLSDRASAPRDRFGDARSGQISGRRSPDGGGTVRTKDGVRMFVTGQSTTAGTYDTGVEVDMTTIAYFEPWRR